MRTQTIATRFDAQELLAPPVDTTGWLAGPTGSGRERLNRLGPEHQGVHRTGLDRTGVDQHPATAIDPEVDRRAEDGRPVRSGNRSARRSGRVRHLRRVRTEGRRPAPLRMRASGEAVQTTTEVVAAAPTESASVIRSAPEGYRIGRWARLTLTITVLAATVVVVASLIAPAGPQALVDVTVAPGDTLWSIATEAAPDRDPRDVIDEIRQLNDMGSGALPVGVVLRVPASVG